MPKPQRPRITPEYLSISQLAQYSGIGERTLRDLLKDPVDPIPYFRFGSAGKIIRVKRSEFDAWAEKYREDGGARVDAIVNDVLASLTSKNYTPSRVRNRRRGS